MFKLIHKRVPSNAKNDILSGLTVALALVPALVPAPAAWMLSWTSLGSDDAAPALHEQSARRK